MKKKYIAALLLGSSFFMLTGFDSKLTSQEILDASSEAIRQIKELNSVSGNIECRMKAQVSLSSEDGSIPEVSTTALNRISGDFTVLNDSSMEMDLKWKVVLPGMQDTMALRFYRFSGENGFQNYFYDSANDEWMKTVFPMETDRRFMSIMKYGFSAFTGQNTSLFLPEGEIDGEDLFNYMPKDLYSEQEIEELEDLCEPFLSVIKIKADRVTVSPLPAEIDGASCYKLEQDISYDIDGLSEILEQLCLDMNEASSAEASESICKEEMEELFRLCELAEELMNDIPIKMTYYIDDTTFLPVKEILDLSGLDFSAFLQELAEWSVEYERYGLDSEKDAAIPKIGLSFPEYKMEISYKLNETDEIKIPSDALYAQKIEPESDMEWEPNTELK